MANRLVCYIFIVGALALTCQLKGEEKPLQSKPLQDQAAEELAKTDKLVPEEFLQTLTAMLSDKKVQAQFQSSAESIRFSFADETDEEKQAVCDKTNKQHFDFYHDYISKYYPKVFVIRNLFEAMDAEAVEKALRDIILLFARQPWFYFVNEDHKFNTPMYWEYIVDQCSFMNDFLQQARVDLTTKKVSWEPDYRYGSSYRVRFGGHLLRGNARQRVPQTKSLYLYLKSTAKGCVYDFYALCFDYLIKLFNEGILLKDIKQAQRYLYELEFVVERLRGSRYESDYQEAIKVCKELLNRLKKIINSQELHNDEFDEKNYDEHTSKMVKEAKELGYA